MTPRAVRNNNPGNVRVGDKWQGLMPPDEMTDEQKAEKDFCVFQSPKYGFRALGRVLIKYQDAYNIRSIRAAISRWAPPSENDTGSYIAHVCLLSGLGPDQTLDLHSYADLAPIAKAITTHECGGWFFDDKDLEAGMRLAGVEPPVAALAQSRTIKTGLAGLTLPAATGAIVEAVQQLRPAIEIVAKVKEYWAPAAITILVVAVGAMIYFRIDDWMRAKR